MKLPRLLILASLVCALAPAAFGESPYERELKDLIEQRDVALKAATAPVNARFKAAAEQLLRRATQNNDLEAANKINAALGLLASATTATSPVGGLKDLRRQLAGTTWILLANVKPRGGLTNKITFTDKTVDPGNYKYEASRDSVVVTFNRGGTETLELTKDGLHLQYPKGAVAYELSIPK